MSVAQGEDGTPGQTMPGRILLVDDQAQNRDMLGRRLERRGYQVLLRESAIGIEDLIAEENIELVLLDWVMPDRPGHDALLGIRARFDAERVPVIVVTALDDSGVVAKVLEGGANDYISKPIDLRVLTARVKAQLDRRQAVLELDAARNNLEQAVIERTQDLVTANETLSVEIGERQAAEARAQSLARHDPLTGLANRRHFLEELQRRVGLVSHEQSAFALMFIDLDRFKPINDVHGHAVGDELLSTIGSRLATCTREDSFVARLGGDEFAVLLEGPACREAVAAAAKRMLSELAAPIVINGLKLVVGASIGVAICPEDGDDAVELLRRGDAAMLYAKEARGSFQFYNATLDRQMKVKAALEGELRVAIARGDIIPNFQPVVRLKDHSLAGYEVLARWTHEQMGVVSPASFIPVAEEAGLVDAMFWTLLAQACRKALAAPGQFTLAVNISPSQIRDQWFPEKVLRTLRETGFPAQRLEVEVTETAMFGDMARGKGALASLKNQGVRVALDDFGTGYSSLFLLRELPIDRLKIDCSFVGQMNHNRESATIVGALVGLGRALGLDVTAEGVEDYATATALRELGCVYAQGYLFGAASGALDYSGGDQRAVG
ncbi:MAG: EAL domain-containing protein [Terricaulis sp.]